MEKASVAIRPVGCLPTAYFSLTFTHLRAHMMPPFNRTLFYVFYTLSARIKNLSNWTQIEERISFLGFILFFNLSESTLQYLRFLLLLMIIIISRGKSDTCVYAKAIEWTRR